MSGRKIEKRIGESQDQDENSEKGEEVKQRSNYIHSQSIVDKLNDVQCSHYKENRTLT